MTKPKQSALFIPWTLTMLNRLKKLFRDDEAATAVEYAVLLALILVAVIGAIATFGSETGGLWGGIDTRLEATRFGGP
jgi:pilus assembly protein Flp/PilA